MLPWFDVFLQIPSAFPHSLHTHFSLLFLPRTVMITKLLRQSGWRGSSLLPTRAGPWQSTRVDTRAPSALRRLVYIAAVSALALLLLLAVVRTLSPSPPIADVTLLPPPSLLTVRSQLHAPKAQISEMLVDVDAVGAGAGAGAAGATPPEAAPVVTVPPAAAGAPAAPDAPAPAPAHPDDPLLFIVISATRPNGTDYATPLLREIFAAFAAASPSSESKLRVLLYDADLPSARRPAAWFDALPGGVEVRRAPKEALAQLASVNTDPRRDKHHDPAPRIAWRTKGAKVSSQSHSHTAHTR